MNLSWPAAAALVLTGTAAVHAGDRFELSGHLGPSFPFYDQTFQYQATTLPGAAIFTVEQVTPFRLEAKGGLALGGDLAWYFREPFGLEARVDTAGLDVRSSDARFRIRVRVPSIPDLPEITQDLATGTANVDVDRPRPLSLNLRARRRGRPGLFASGGISYLPRMHLGLEFASLALEAEALPVDEDEGHWGANIGGGLSLELPHRLAATVDGRYFHFQKRTLRWALPSVPPSTFDQAFAPLIAEKLPSVEFDPTYFQIAFGLAWRF